MKSLIEMMKKKILVVGDVMLDTYIIGKVNRISPEAPVPIVNVSKEENRLGGSCNVANNIAKLEFEAYSFGVVGNDEGCNIIKELMADNKVNDRLLGIDTIPTTRKMRIIGDKQQITRLDYEKKITDDNLIINNLKEILSVEKFDAIVISDYNKGVCSNLVCTFLVQYASDNNTPIVIDPKGKNWEKYQKAFIVTPNLKEAEEIVGYQIPNEDNLVELAGKEIMDRFHLQNLLITRSEKGMSLIQRNVKTLHYPTTAKDVFDVSGAGDTVVAVLTTSLVAGNTLEQAINIANIAAGYVITKFGTYAISKEELNSL